MPDEPRKAVEAGTEDNEIRQGGVLRWPDLIDNGRRRNRYKGQIADESNAAWAESRDSTTAVTVQVIEIDHVMLHEHRQHRQHKLKSTFDFVIYYDSHSQPKQTTNKPVLLFYPTTLTTMETVKQAADYVSESVKGAVSGTSHEANKQVAKDSDANVTTRLTAAKDAVGDKIDQKGHDAKADVHKEATK
ncbi:hypothetical protein E4U53_002572 [Claviceps sorghi]|nr:hypothetical protein E4U53_002572 [Claviceps sorghi]